MTRELLDQEWLTVSEVCGILKITPYRLICLMIEGRLTGVFRKDRKRPYFPGHQVRPIMFELRRERSLAARAQRDIDRMRARQAYEARILPMNGGRPGA